MQTTFDTLWNFVIAYWQPIVAVLLIIIGYIFGAKTKITAWFKGAWALVLKAILFVLSIFREDDKADGTAGKASYTRIIGTYVIYELIKMSWVKLAQPTYEIPSIMWTMFVLTTGGFMFLKIYAAAGDHIDSLIDGYVAKLSGNTILPQNQPAKDPTAAKSDHA